MIAAPLLASIGIALAPPTGQVDASNPAGIFEDEISVSMRFEETEFAAQSLSRAPLLLIFASEDQDLQTAFWLPPGARYQEEFPRGTLSGLVLEVLAIADGDWTSTGSIVLGDSLPLLQGGLWVMNCGHVLAQSEGESLTAAAPDGSTLPPSINALTKEDPDAEGDDHTTPHAPSFHVPVPTPTDKPKENKPPKLRPKPLPPV